VFEGRTVRHSESDFDFGVPTKVDPRFVHTTVKEKLARGYSNAELMREGNARIGSDGRTINLHHTLGEESGPLVELLGSTHQRYKKPMHWLIEDGNGFRKSLHLKRQFGECRGRHWKWRLQQLEGK
jgi:hypothetical protein